jgi:predicted RNA-binding Zn ribbon-like protein
MGGASPLAVEFANTRRRRGADYQDVLCSGADLETWAADDGRVPAVGATSAEPRLDEVRALRDEVFGLLLAAVRGLPAAAERVNAALLAVPLVPQLERDGRAHLHAPAPVDALDELLARVAASAIELASAGPESPLALCDAPSCGRFFLRHRRDQRWCSAACGTRARVARHAAHRRSR